MKSLARVFKFKSADKWTACEIQERLDENMLEKKTRAAFVQQPMSNRAVHKLLSLAENRSVLRAAEPSVAPVPSPAAAFPADTNDCVRSLVNLLDRLVMQQTQVPANLGALAQIAQSSQRTCRVCGTRDHTTLSHCRKENQCLRCFSPGQWKRNCPQHVPPHQSHSADSSVGQAQCLK